MTDLFSCLEDSFRSNSGAVAIISDEKKITYNELEQQSNKLVKSMYSRGIRPGDIIAIYLNDRYQAIASIIAVLKLGCTYLPLDPVYPSNRLEYMIKDSLVKLIITDRNDLDYLNITKINSIDKAVLAEEVIVDIDLRVISKAPISYIIYTSGTTGNPKGVMMKYDVLSNLIFWQNKQPSGNSPFITAQFSQLSFDVSFQEIFSTLCAGGTLHLLSDTIKQDFQLLIKYIDAHSIERIFLPYIALLNLAQ